VVEGGERWGEETQRRGDSIERNSRAVASRSPLAAASRQKDMASEENNTQGQVPAPPRHRKRKTRSIMYQHFTPNDLETRWSCKDCGVEVGASKTNKHGTGNLRKHHRKCKGRGGDGESQHSHPTSSSLPLLQPQPQLLPSGPGESSCREPAGLDDQEASRDLARMIALHGHDPSVVEDDYFRSFVRRLNPQFKLPSRDAIEDLCCDIFQIHRLDMLESCLYAAGRLSLAVDVAKTMEAGEVRYATRQFIDGEWNLHKEVDDAYVVLPPGDQNLCSSFFWYTCCFS